MSAKGVEVLTKTKAKTQLEDSLQSHGLPKKRLLSTEAERILRILKNCIRRVEIAATLPALIRLNSVSGVEDKKLSRALQEHELLYKRLETMEREEEAGETRQRARLQLEKDIKNSVRNLLRLLQAQPDGISGLRADLGTMEEGKSEYVLISALEKFHSNMVEKLLTTADEELQLVLKKRVPSSPGHNLQDSLSGEEEVLVDAVDADISMKNHTIQELQSSLQGSDTQEVAISHTKTSTVKQTSLQQEVDQLNIQLNNLMLENRQAERVIQEKNEKVETEIEYLLQNFDDEIGQMQANLELNEMHYDREVEELRKLEKAFSVLEVEHNKIQDRRRLAEEKRREEMKELELKTKAAILAQAWWRGYSTRKALKNKGKSKKAKKGKGKKAK